MARSTSSVTSGRAQKRKGTSVVPRPGATLAPDEIMEFLRPQLATWALPDEVRLIDAVPKTSVGKFDKKVLRERFKDWSPAG